jgi:hypothetical protein
VARTALLTVAALVLLPAAALAAPPDRDAVVRDAIAALGEDPIYVAPGADLEDRAEVKRAIAKPGVAPMFVVVLPPEAVASGADADRLLREIGMKSKREGTYFMSAGQETTAGSTLLESGQAARLAEEAVEEHGDEGVAAVVLDLAERVGDARAGLVTRETGGDDGGGGPKWWIAGALLLPLALVLWYARRIRRAGAAQPPDG